jgi:hypothetical protein
MNEYWTADQLARIQDTIKTELENSRLSHKVIPVFALDTAARAVSRDTFNYETVAIDDSDQAQLTELDVTFKVPRLQSDDADLSRPLTLIRRATQKLARLDDEAVFVTTIRDQINNSQGNSGFHPVIRVRPPDGDGLIAATDEAITRLDDAGYRDCYWFIAGIITHRFLFTRTKGAADLPINAVRGLLNDGPVLRAGVLDPNEALVLSLRVAQDGSSPIDRAVAVEPQIEYQRIDDADSRVFVLRERFTPRFKETLTAVLLRIDGHAGQQ